MILDIAQSMSLLIISILAIIILLRILMIVHGQNRQVKDLENRLQAIETTRDNVDITYEEPTTVTKEQ